MTEPFRTLVADPPWQFGDKLPGPKRGAAKHYRTMSVAELAGFELPPLADDAYLLLWRVASMQREALDVAHYWGFVVKSELVWCKLTKTGLRHFGMGRHVRASHETCLLCTRGRPKPLSHSVRSTFDAPVGRHSEKPERFYELVEQLCPGPRAELFARRHRAGWQCFGDELGEAA
jgi:N6-adenosine-specific RNA methylase IME4